MIHHGSGNYFTAEAWMIRDEDKAPTEIRRHAVLHKPSLLADGGFSQ